MNIPSEAVEAVALAIAGYDSAPGDNRQEHQEAAREALEIAAPLFAAQVLRDEADYLDSALNAVLDGDPEDLSASGIIQRLRNRANEPDPR